jgi:hypothetical protein
LPGGISLCSKCTTIVAVAGQNISRTGGVFRFGGALSSSSILPAPISWTSGCPFEVGLALIKSHMVVGAPRSYLNPRASTLASDNSCPELWTMHHQKNIKTFPGVSYLSSLCTISPHFQGEGSRANHLSIFRNILYNLGLVVD